MTDSLLHFMMNYFFILCTLETKKNMLLFWTGFFGHCLFPFAGPSISMLLFLRVTTPELAKSTENQGDTSPVQMCCYNRMSLMGAFKKKRERGKREMNLSGGGVEDPWEYSSIYLTNLQLKTVSACII